MAEEDQRKSVQASQRPPQNPQQSSHDVTIQIESETGDSTPQQTDYVER